MSRAEARLAAVAAISRSLLTELAPSQAATFDQELALWLAAPLHLKAQEQSPAQELVLPLASWARQKSLAPPKPPPAGQGLEATLVAGMFLQVILEAEHLPGTPLERTCFVKKAVKQFLVERLAGQITLSQFFRLVELIEEEVGYYFQRLQGQWLAAVPEPPAPLTPPAPAAPQPCIAALQTALQGLPLPQQANRKLSPAGLLDFLVATQGRWFRLLDFEAHFRLNKKTAWSYLTLLQRQGILRHNDQKANRVRYALETKFLTYPPGGNGSQESSVSTSV